MNAFNRLLFISLVALACHACTSFKPFKFAHLTDTQIGFMDNSDGFVHSDSLFKAAASGVNAEKPDLVFITGDLVDNTADSLQNTLFEVGMKRIEAPVWLVPGNHDYNKAWTPEIRDRYVARYGYEKFSFIHKKCAFIGIDSNCIMEDAAEEEAKQMSWLKSELAAARKCRHIFIFFHCPIFRKTVDEPHDYSNFPVEKRNEYISLFKDHGVTAVFTGHTHEDFDFEYEGIRFVIGNPVCNPLGHGHPGYNIIDVTKDGIEVRSIDSSSFDSYPKAKGVTRIVQYNVGVFSKEIENSIPMVAAMMKEIGADAMSLNELDSCNTRHPNNQLADFAKEMGGWNSNYSRAMAYREGAYGVGVAVPDKIKYSFTIALPRGDGLEPRACSVVETRKYVLASTHLDYKDEPSIIIQARTINEALATRYSKTRKPVFLAGDMNSTPDSKVLEELKKKWDVVSCIKNTYSATDPHGCIDFILALRNRAKYKVVGSDVPTVFKNGDVAVASDHLPVYVDVKL